MSTTWMTHGFFSTSVWRFAMLILMVLILWRVW